MKWFIVLIALQGNVTTVVVEDNQPYATPDICWAEARKIQAKATPGRNPVRALCGMNAVAANFLLKEVN